MTASKPALFSPLALGATRAPNRLTLAALPSGCASADGRAGDALCAYYLERARGGLGVIVTEPVWPVAPPTVAQPHLALYDDSFIPDLSASLAAVHGAGVAAIVMLDQPLDLAQLSGAALAEIGAAFVTAAWRARTAGADGVMLSTCDGGPFAQLVSPLLNQRGDQHGAGIDGRLWLLTSVVEGIGRWLGPEVVIGVRLIVEEFAHGGITLHDARVMARRLVSAGVRLLEIGTRHTGDSPLAQFPGWKLPLAAAIRAVVDVPVLVGGQMDDVELADAAVRDGSADLIDVAECLLSEPLWPLKARAALAASLRASP